MTILEHSIITTAKFWETIKATFQAIANLTDHSEIFDICEHAIEQMDEFQQQAKPGEVPVFKSILNPIITRLTEINEVNELGLDSEEIEKHAITIDALNRAISHGWSYFLVQEKSGTVARFSLYFVTEDHQVQIFFIGPKLMQYLGCKFRKENTAERFITPWTFAGALSHAHSQAHLATRELAKLLKDCGGPELTFDSNNVFRSS